MEKLFYSPIEFPSTSGAVSVQAAIDAAVKTDIRTVVIPEGDWYFDKTVYLPEGITVIIDGATIRSRKTAFKNSNADNPKTKSLGGEESDIFIVGLRGAMLVSEDQSPEIYLSNVKEYRISGLTFAGGGLELNFARYGRVDMLKFENSLFGVLLSEGSNNNLISDILANTKGSAVELRGKESYMFGRGLEMAENIISRIKSESSSALTMSTGPCEIYNTIIRDVTCLADAPAVVIGDEKDTFTPLDITVRGVESKGLSLKVTTDCDGLFASEMSGKVEMSKELQRCFIDEKTGSALPPRFNEYYVNEFITPCDSRFFGKNDSETIQNALDFAIKEKKALLIPRYNARTNTTVWELDEAILVSSDAKIFLLRASVRMADYSYENAFMVQNVDNVLIAGIGDAEINGGVFNGLTERQSEKFGIDIRRNSSIFVYGAKGFTLDGIKIKSSRWHSLYISNSSDITVKDIAFTVHPLLPDLGGAVITGKTKNVTFENINGIVGEELITVAMYEGKFYSEKEDDSVENLTLKNISVNVSRRSVLRLICHDGRRIKGIKVDCVLDPSLPEEKKCPWSVVSIGCYNGAVKRSCTTDELCDIAVRDLYSRGDRIVELCGNSSGVICENLHGFGSVANALQSTHFAHSEDLHLNGVFFRCIQGSRYMRGTATSTITDKKKYIGTTAFLKGFTSSAIMENVFVDKNGDAFRVYGGGILEVKNFTINELGRNLVLTDDTSNVVINGVKY